MPDRPAHDDRPFRLSPGHAFVGVLAIYGVRFTDYADFAAIVADPFTALADPQRQFLHTSPLLFFLGWPVAKVGGPTLAYIACIAAGLATLAGALASWAAARPPAARRAALLVLQASPLTLVLLSWLGKGDAFLVAAYLAFRLCRARPVLAGLTAMAMLLAHREIGVVVLVGDAVLARSIAPGAVAGGAIGLGLTWLYTSHLQGFVLSRIGLASTFLKAAKAGWVANPVCHVLFGIGWTWIFVLREVGRRPEWRLAFVVVLVYAAAFTTADFTRVATLCSLPLLVHLAEAEVERDGGREVASSLWAPAIALLQVQLFSFDQIRDSEWLLHAVDLWHGIGPF